MGEVRSTGIPVRNSDGARASLPVSVYGLEAHVPLCVAQAFSLCSLACDVGEKPMLRNGGYN